MLHSPLRGVLFPGGSPSLNQNHPAARKPRMINVAVNGGFRNLLTNNVYGCFDPTVTLPSSFGVLGRTVYSPAITAARITVGIPAVIPNEVLPQATIAAIWKVPLIATYQGGGSVVNDNWEMDAGILINTRPGLNIGCTAYPTGPFMALSFGGNGIFTFGVVPGHSYFAAATLNRPPLNPNSGYTQLILRDLTTGLIRYNRLTTNYQTTTGTSYSALTYNATNPADPNYIAANMLSASTLSPAQLFAWAEDPWSLWYKPSTRRTIFLGTPPGTNTPLGSYVDFTGPLGSVSVLHGDVSTTTSPYVELAGDLVSSFTLHGDLTGADSVLTHYYLWQKPIVGASDDVWGIMLNSDLDAIDSVVNTLSSNIPAASTVAPQMDGFANPGNISTTTYSKSDHVHPSDTSRAAVTAIPQPSDANPNMDGAQSSGTDAHYSRADHRHPSNTSLASGASPQPNGVATPGVHSLYSRDDHVHPTDTTLLPLSGGTVTGVINVSPPAAFPTISLNKPASGSVNQLVGTTTGSLRWVVCLGDSSAESGVSTGSNFTINAYDNSGVLLGQPLIMNRQMGVQFEGTVSLSPLTAIDPTFILNKPTGTRLNQIVGAMNSTPRWIVTIGDTTAETSGNHGSDFSINSFDNTGSYINTPIFIERATGTVATRGTSTNDSANPSYVGEYKSVSQTSAVSMVNNTDKTVTSLSLTAGDWDVEGQIGIAFTTSGVDAIGAISLVNNVRPTLDFGQCESAANQIFYFQGATGLKRISLSATTLVYLVGLASFSTGSASSTGFIRARRVR
jgi:hypothetical protein